MGQDLRELKHVSQDDGDSDMRVSACWVVGRVQWLLLELLSERKLAL